jgi:hypothetical protein
MGITDRAATRGVFSTTRSGTRLASALGASFGEGEDWSFSGAVTEFSIRCFTVPPGGEIRSDGGGVGGPFVRVPDIELSSDYCRGVLDRVGLSGLAGD